MKFEKNSMKNRWKTLSEKQEKKIGLRKKIYECDEKTVTKVNIVE